MELDKPSKIVILKLNPRVLQEMEKQSSKRKMDAQIPEDAVGHVSGEETKLAIPENSQFENLEAESAAILPKPNEPSAVLSTPLFPIGNFTDPDRLAMRQPSKPPPSYALWVSTTSKDLNTPQQRTKEFDCIADEGATDETSLKRKRH